MKSNFFTNNILTDKALAKFLSAMQKSLVIVTDSNMQAYAEKIKNYLHLLQIYYSNVLKKI